MLWRECGTDAEMGVALMDIWGGPTWYFFSLRRRHAVSPDNYSSPQPKQLPRYPNRPGRFTNHLGRPSLGPRCSPVYHARSRSECNVLDFNRSPASITFKCHFLNVINGNRLYRTPPNPLSVQEINLKACTLVILNQIIWPDCDSNQGPTSNPLKSSTHQQGTSIQQNWQNTTRLEAELGSSASGMTCVTHVKQCFPKLVYTPEGIHEKTMMVHNTMQD